MSPLLDVTHSAGAVGADGGRVITIGLVNNMPDTAWEATERQFLALVRAAANARANTPVRLKLFSITDLPRAEHVRRELAERYRGVSELWSTRLDGLIVTGAEPRASDLRDEPYWTTLAALVDWARLNTVSTIWSCLAAHAAVLHADGIERRPLAEKQCGVFDCKTMAAHPLTKGAALLRPVPHSRWNDLPEQALTSCGYRILTRSAAAGVDMFARQEPNLHSLFLFLQGHPEYEAGTLLREYRRDIGRFLRGEQERYPATPQGYLSEAASAIVDAFRTGALDERRADLIADFPTRALEVGLSARWQRPAVGIYERWLDYLKERKTERPTAPIARRAPPRRAWRSDAGRPAADG